MKNGLFDRLRDLNIEYHQYMHGERYYERGVDLLSSDWDNLLLLDGCRYDMFKSEVNLPGTLKKRKSRGSMTAQFLEGNFAGRDATDTVYVTASPMLRRIEDEHSFKFHDIIDVSDSDGWDTEQGTVLPETMVDYGVEAGEKFKNKRLIIHLMQPHFPFIAADTEFDKQIPDPAVEEETQFWMEIKSGDINIDSDIIWDAYKQNLNVALPAVKSLLKKLSGKTVVTSDHGNMIGERASPIPVREWGHPRGLYTPELIEIPWLVYKTGDRKEIISEIPAEDRTLKKESANAKRRLKSLGYLNQ